MGQATPPQWWEIIAGILSIPATIIGVAYSYMLIQKTRLEVQKTRLEILEMEKKIRGKKKTQIISSEKASSSKKSPIQKILLDIQAGENHLTNILLDVLSPFKTFQQDKSTVSINGQRILGAVIEFIFLLLFLYTDLSQGVQTLAILFPTTSIPPYLTDITIPLFISSAGTAMILGIMLGDLLGVTNLTSWADLRERKKPFLVVILTTLVTSVLLSSLIGMYRVNLFVDSSPNFQSAISVAASFAQSLIILPILVTTFLLMNAVQGVFIVIALFLVILRLPLTLFRKFVSKIIYYFSG